MENLGPIFLIKILKGGGGCSMAHSVKAPSPHSLGSKPDQVCANCGQ